MSRQLSTDDRKLLRRIVYEEERITTDLNPETLFQKVEDLRARLLDTASEGETTSYTEVTDGFSLVHWSRVGSLLGIIGLFEDQTGNPLLPAVVSRGDESRVSEGYFKLVEKTGESVPDDEAERRERWQSHLAEVHDHWG